jgi:hypothetical protein
LAAHILPRLPKAALEVVEAELQQARSDLAAAQARAQTAEAAAAAPADALAAATTTNAVPAAGDPHGAVHVAHDSMDEAEQSGEKGWEARRRAHVRGGDGGVATRATPGRFSSHASQRSQHSIGAEGEKEADAGRALEVPPRNQRSRPGRGKEASSKGAAGKEAASRQAFGGERGGKAEDGDAHLATKTPFISEHDAARPGPPAAPPSTAAGLRPQHGCAWDLGSPSGGG